MLNFRHKFIKTAIDFLTSRKYELTEWEYNFLASVDNINSLGLELTTSQFNTLTNIYNKLRGIK